MVAGFIDDIQLKLIEYHLTQPNIVFIKDGLRWLCDQLNAGRIPKSTHTIYTLLRGMASHTEKDVVVWALKCIAALPGQESRGFRECVRGVLLSADKASEVFALSAACLYRISADDTGVLDNLKREHFGGERLVELILMLYGYEEFCAKFKAQPIDMDGSSPIVLQYVCLAYGLDRDVENILHPKFPNSEVIGALFSSPNDMVRQYCCWSLLHRPNAKSDQLHVDPRNILDEPSNVRRWGYKLLSQSPDDTLVNFEILREGARDQSSRVRLGLAEQIERHRLDELSSIVQPWYETEDDAEIKEILVRHMARNSSKNVQNRRVVLDHVESANSNQMQVELLLEAAQGTKLWAEIDDLRSSKTNQLNLFEGGQAAVTQNFNIGSVNAQNVSITGDVTQKGEHIEYTQYFNQQNINDITRVLETLSRVEQLDSAEKEKAKSFIERLSTGGKEVLKEITQWATSLNGLYEAGSEVVQNSTELLSYLPDLSSFG